MPIYEYKVSMTLWPSMSGFPYNIHAYSSTTTVEVGMCIFVHVRSSVLTFYHCTTYLLCALSQKRSYTTIYIYTKGGKKENRSTTAGIAVRATSTVDR